MTVTVIDNFEIGEQKAKIEQEIIRILLQMFPEHRIAYPFRGPRGWSTRWSDQSGKTNRTSTSDGDITQIEFGLLGKKNEDKRKRVFLNFAVGVAPEPSVALGSITIEFESAEVIVEKITIEVYGTENKAKFLDFVKKIKAAKILNPFPDIIVKVVTDRTRYENEYFETD